MTRLLVLAEGDSEELFVKRMLAPHLEGFSIYATAIPVVTKILANGRKYSGGNQWPKLLNTLKPMLHQKDAWVTTLLDYYGLPDSFPGAHEARCAHTPEDGIRLLEQSFFDVLSSPKRFIPFFAKYEFEAWYFAGIQKIAEHFDRNEIASKLSVVVHDCGGPEQINHGRDTHPSARLKALGVGFQKTSEISLLEKIGIPAIRNACPHFAQWLRRLEDLGTPVV